MFWAYDIARKISRRGSSRGAARARGVNAYGVATTLRRTPWRENLVKRLTTATYHTLFLAVISMMLLYTSLSAACHRPHARIPAASVLGERDVLTATRLRRLLYWAYSAQHTHAALRGSRWRALVYALHLAYL